MSGWDRRTEMEAWRRILDPGEFTNFPTRRWEKIIGAPEAAAPVSAVSVNKPVDAGFLKSLAWSLRRAGFVNLADAAECGKLVDAPAPEPEITRDTGRISGSAVVEILYDRLMDAPLGVEPVKAAGSKETVAPSPSPLPSNYAAKFDRYSLARLMVE